MSWLSKITGRDKAREGLQNVQAMGQQATAAGQAQKAADPLSDVNLRGRYAHALDDTSSGAGWEDAFNKTAGATINNALPGLRQGLQLTREDAIRRGVSTGDLGTSNEGDFVSAWQRNLSNAMAGQSLNAYEGNQNNYLDLLTGAMDRNTAQQNYQNEQNAQAKKRKGGLLGGLGALAGGVLGNTFFPGIGGTLGAQIGGAVGGGIGGY